MEIKTADIVLCEFYFSDLKTSKKRPVLVFKDNLPYDDFVGIPISSQTRQMHLDEGLLEAGDFVEGGIPKTSKLMLRKPFVISKTAIIKKYGSLSQDAFKRYQQLFCRYFNCGIQHPDNACISILDYLSIIAARH